MDRAKKKKTSMLNLFHRTVSACKRTGGPMLVFSLWETGSQWIEVATFRLSMFPDGSA